MHIFWALNSAPFSLVFLLGCPPEAWASEKGSRLALQGDRHEFSWGDIGCSSTEGSQHFFSLTWRNSTEAFLPPDVLKPSEDVKHMPSKAERVLSQLIPKAPGAVTLPVLPCTPGGRRRWLMDTRGLTQLCPAPLGADRSRWIFRLHLLKSKPKPTGAIGNKMKGNESLYFNVVQRTKRVMMQSEAWANGIWGAREQRRKRRDCSWCWES